MKNKEEWMDSLPGFLFWKDRNSVYRNCNRRFAKAGGVTADRIVGQLDENLPWAEHVAKYHQDDQKAMNGEIVTTIEPFILADRTRLWVKCVKQQDLNEQGGVIGMWGYAIPLIGRESVKTPLIDSMDVKYFGEGIQVGYRIIKAFEWLNLSVRESECLFYLIRGKTAKSIAAKLNLSVRTVESYIDYIKFKMGCYTKEDLIGKAFDLDLIAYIPESVLS